MRHVIELVAGLIIFAIYPMLMYVAARRHGYYHLATATLLATLLGLGPLLGIVTAWELRRLRRIAPRIMEPEPVMDSHLPDDLLPAELLQVTHHAA